jgi:hypothetical protein
LRGTIFHYGKSKFSSNFSSAEVWKWFFLLSTYELWKVLVSPAKIKIIANFHVLGLFMLKNKLRAKKKFRLSRGVAGVAVRALVEICVDDISAVLRATDLGFQLPFDSWTGLMHLILRTLKF